MNTKLAFKICQSQERFCAFFYTFSFFCAIFAKDSANREKNIQACLKMLFRDAAYFMKRQVAIGNL